MEVYKRPVFTRKNKEFDYKKMEVFAQNFKDLYLLEDKCEYKLYYHEPLKDFYKLNEILNNIENSSDSNNDKYIKKLDAINTHFEALDTVFKFLRHKETKRPANYYLTKSSQIKIYPDRPLGLPTFLCEEIKEQYERFKFLDIDKEQVLALDYDYETIIKPKTLEDFTLIDLMNTHLTKYYHTKIFKIDISLNSAS